jgi:alcohol dehydrogenase
MLLGHEAAGIVEEIGEGVSNLEPGDRVVLTFLPRCGECSGCQTEGRLPCHVGTESNTAGTLLEGGIKLQRAGVPVFHHLGVSGFATHAVVDHRSVVRVDPDVPAEVAALLGCAVLTGGGAILNEANLKEGDTTVVVGLGGVGMAALLTALALNKGPVIGVDLSAEKQALALGFGASEVFDPARAEASEARGDVVVEAVGHPAAFETAMVMTAPGGQTIALGLPHPDARASITPLGLVTEARSVTGSYMGSALPQRDVSILAKLWRSGDLPIERLTDLHIDFDEINEGMDNLADGRVLRQMINFPLTIHGATIFTDADVKEFRA